MADLNRPDVMKVADLAGRPGLRLESRDDRLGMEDPLLRGQFWHRELRRGLFVHASDVFEEADFTATSTHHAGLSCVFFLSGEVDVEIGERRFEFRGTGDLRNGLIISSARSDSFRRLSRGHQQIRHLVVSVTPEWLVREGLGSVDDHRLVDCLLRDHLASRSWSVTPRLADLVQRILAPCGEHALLQDLMVESAAVEIMVEALSAATHQDGAAGPARLSASDRARLRRADEYIHGCHGARLHCEDIAREAGVSVSGLQRLYKCAYGIGVIERMRRVRLDEARRLLESGESSIKEAATYAGYGSAANFATAFKRQFGVSPRSASRSS